MRPRSPRTSSIREVGRPTAQGWRETRSHQDRPDHPTPTSSTQCPAARRDPHRRQEARRGEPGASPHFATPEQARGFAHSQELVWPGGRVNRVVRSIQVGRWLEVARRDGPERRRRGLASCCVWGSTAVTCSCSERAPRHRRRGDPLEERMRNQGVGRIRSPRGHISSPISAVHEGLAGGRLRGPTVPRPRGARAGVNPPFG